MEIAYLLFVIAGKLVVSFIALALVFLYFSVVIWSLGFLLVICSKDEEFSLRLVSVAGLVGAGVIAYFGYQGLQIMIPDVYELVVKWWPIMPTPK